MKFLYVAHDRRAAETAAHALRRIAPDTFVTWARTPAAAAGWVSDNRDAQAVIVDPGAENPASTAIAEEVRRLGASTPVAVVAPEHLERLLAALQARLDSAVQRERRRREDLEQHVRAIEEWRREAQQRFAQEKAQLDIALARATRICTALQERLLELEPALQAAERRHVADAEAAEQAARRESELSAALDVAVAASVDLERRLADAAAAHRQDRERADAELAATAGRCALLEERLAREAIGRASLEDRIAAAERTRQQADEAHAAEMASLAAQLADRDARHGASLSRVSRICTALQKRLLDLEAMLRDADERHTADVAAIERLKSGEAELSAALTGAASARTALEHRLSEITLAYERAAADLASAGGRIATLEIQLRDEAAARSTLEQRLTDAEEVRRTSERQAIELASLAARLNDLQSRYEAAIDESALRERQLRDTAATLARAGERVAELTAASERLARRETELSASLGEAIAARVAADHASAEADAAHQRARQHAAADLAAAAERYAALEYRLRQERDARTTFENQLAASDVERQHAEARHAAELATLRTRLGDVEACYDDARTRIGSLEQRLRESAAALEETRHDSKSEVSAVLARLAQRERELGAALAEALAARDGVERTLADAAAAHQRAREQNAADLAAAAGRIAALETQLNQEAHARAALHDHLTAADRARQEAEHRHAAEVAALTAELADFQARHEAAEEQAAALGRELAQTTAALEHTRRAWKAEVASAAEHLAQRETDLKAVINEAIAARVAVEQKLLEAQAALRLAQERAAADMAAAHERRAALEGQVEAATRDVVRHQGEAAALHRRLDALKTHAAALRRDVDRVPLLQLQLDESRKETRRQFERAPYGLCECTREGAIVRANHSLAMLLGYRSSAELLSIDAAATVFECAADLRWLLERVERPGRAQTVETMLRTRDGRRLPVRLHALKNDRSIVMAVEDLTSVYAIEQRLREAQRLEAVGRVASEIAVTCETLLRDVTEWGQQWLAGFERDTPLRTQGELLLADVTRAAGFLRQFVAYGQRAISSVGPVDVQRVLREMKPVLKRVLGEDIVLVVPKTASRFEVDVDAERVERILVNVANYARERMPLGGRVQVQLSSTVVDQQFRARHPEVRPGSHVLITVTETQGAIHSAPRLATPAVVADRPVSVKPGMDLSALVALIGDLGGHLWMSAEPDGTMTLRIHLPSRSQFTEPAVSSSWAERGRQLVRWFRHH